MNYYLLAVVIIFVIAVAFFIIRRMTASTPSAAAEKLDDQRFARLLVTELKLYNQHAVEAGRENKDLYHRLRSEIDRARQMYDQRTGARAGAHGDYFHEELVRDLAGGDESNLGLDYPGQNTTESGKPRSDAS